MQLKVKVLSEKIGREIPLPHYASPGAAGMDLRACTNGSVLLPPGGRALVPTGIAVALPSPDFVALVFARSGLAIRDGITLSNAVGVIDSDYRGEIKVGLVNLSDQPYSIAPGDRIAQIAVLPVLQAEIALVSELDETVRGEGGFGSTGK